MMVGSTQSGILPFRPLVHPDTRIGCHQKVEALRRP
jgi:hypothetical protein